jgi:hypothetical protein
MRRLTSRAKLADMAEIAGMATCCNPEPAIVAISATGAR